MAMILNESRYDAEYFDGQAGQTEKGTIPRLPPRAYVFSGGNDNFDLLNKMDILHRFTFKSSPLWL